MPTSPSPLSTILMKALRQTGSQPYLQRGQSVAAALLAGVDSPIAIFLNEAIAGVQSQVDSINLVLQNPSTLNSLSINSADIATLQVGNLYGPGQLNVFGAGPSFPTAGWVGSESAPFSSPITSIVNTVGGLVTTTVAHGLAVNQVVQISATSDFAQAGTWRIATVPSSTTFTVTGYSGTSTGGTVRRELIGGWFQTLAVGGSSYLNAITNGLFADENGNLSVAAATVKGILSAATVLAGSLNITIILVTGLVLTNNSPGAGNVAWTACTVYYNGLSYNIAAGNTTSGHNFITWTVGNLTFTESSSYTPGPNVFAMATNLGGVGDITWNKLGAVSLQPTQMNDATVNIIGLVLTNNSPGAGNVAWSACTVVYNGATYAITAGNTTSGHLYVTWTVGNTTFTEGASYSPGLTVFAIATNNGGTADVVWNKVGNLHIQPSHLQPALTYDGPNGSLVITGVVFTDNNPAGTVTWSAGTATYKGVTTNIAAGSSTSPNTSIIWQAASPSQFSAVTFGTAIGADDFLIGFKRPSGSPATNGFFSRAFGFVNHTGAMLQFDETGSFHLNAEGQTTFDIHRDSADAAGAKAGGIIDVQDGAGNTTWQTQGHRASFRGKAITVATLPASPVSSERAFVSDASVVAAGNFGTVVAGGGANQVPVYFDGGNWCIG